MSCVLDNGFNLGCNVSGGVKSVYIGTYDPDVTYTTDADDIITVLDANPNSVDCYKFEQDIEFAGLEQTGQFSRENGTVFYESVLSVKFIQLDASLRNLIKALGKAPVFAVIESNAGEFYLLGVDSPGRATEGVASLGVAFGDMNGATLSFTFKSEDPASLCEGTILNTGVADPTLITVNATT
jgi:hypothetical protein